jgi:hypothetical protein
MCAKWRSPAAYSDGSAALGGRARGRRLVMRRLRVVCRLLVRSQYAPSARADRQTHRVAALISPESDTGGELRSASFSGGVRSPSSSMVRAEGGRDRGAIEGGTRRINIGSDMNQRARHTRSPHARRSPDDAGRSAHLRLRDPVWGLLSRLRYMLGGAQVAASMTRSPGLARLEVHGAGSCRTASRASRDLSHLGATCAEPRAQALRRRHGQVARERPVAGDRSSRCAWCPRCARDARSRHVM